MEKENNKESKKLNIVYDGDKKYMYNEEVDELGRGAYGVVWKVHDEEGSYYALKSFSSGVSRDRLQREVKVKDHLDHSHIVVPRVHFRDDRGHDHLVMNYVMHFCSTLEYMHSQSVYHRDLKPANIIMNKQNEPVIVDFGLVRTSQDVTLTVSAQPIGTASYMPPELSSDFSGKDINYELSDVYSMGAIVYKMLSGKNIYEGTTFDEILHKIKKNKKKSLWCNT